MRFISLRKISGFREGWPYHIYSHIESRTYFTYENNRKYKESGGIGAIHILLEKKNILYSISGGGGG